MTTILLNLDKVYTTPIFYMFIVITNEADLLGEELPGGRYSNECFLLVTERIQ